ncbi:TPA_asm: polyprotein [Ribes virus 1]|uniref:RNA-directed RNA polymerase n=1 Tax=Ribes virus 1 TaxID=2977985 RepID=A0A9N6YJH8_9RHAB|nr:TPA_asm: polyprotein [Ribes virus 1]
MDLSEEEKLSTILGLSQDKDEKTLTDLHLGNAINLDIIENFVNGRFDKYELYVPNYLQSGWHKFIKNIPKKEKIVGILPVTLDILMSPRHDARIDQNLYKDIVQIILPGLKERGINIPITLWSKQLLEYNITCHYIYMETFKVVMKLVCMVSEQQRGGDFSVYPEIGISKEVVSSSITIGDIVYEFYVNRNFTAITASNTCNIYLGNFDSILLLLDTLGQRICLDIGMSVGGLCHVRGSVEREISDIIILAGDSILKKYGNSGYDFIGLFEALVVSVLLKENPDPVTESTEFYNNCLNELREMAIEHQWDGYAEETYLNLTVLFSTLRPDALSNIFCMYRIWGHPRVDIKAGMEKVMTKGTMTKLCSNSTSRLVLCQFRKMFLISYFEKHHCYPPVFVHEGNGSYICNMIREQYPISDHHALFSIWDFESVQIRQIWDVPETYDVCHILNDKAVSPNRYELYLSLKEGNGTMTGINRRGIYRWMCGTSIRCKKFLQGINDEGLDEDSLIIGMYEKEREIKIKARMFSLMSENMRMYFVLTEELIANHILKYFPQITMKDPLHVQIRKLWAINQLSGPMSLDPTINIDFEKWNLNMRHEFTEGVFSQLDNMFGFDRLINRTHEIFSGSYIYSSSGKYLPPHDANGLVTDPPMCYIGHQGGFEGLRQKGWTVATVCLLAYVADQLRLKIHLLGQGDNQVVRIYMPHAYWENLGLERRMRELEAKKLLKGYLQGMDHYFTEAGLPIKIRETWISTRLYMYGKYMYLDGITLPQWVKKLLRSYAMSNEGTLTVSGVIGTIATNMSAAAGVSDAPDVMYIIYLILGEWSLEYLFAYHPFTRKSIVSGEEYSFFLPTGNGGRKIKAPLMQKDRLALTILLIPTSVGGSVTIPLTGFIMRGFPDNASEGYAWLKLLMSVNGKYQSMFLNWYSFLKNGSVEADMLVQAPWSLNHCKPPTPGLQSRDTVREWLLSGEFESNIFLKNMAIIGDSFNKKKIAEGLLTEVMNPLISNELFNAFPHTYLESILKRVENTRTIKKMALHLDFREPIILKLMKNEQEFLHYLYWRGTRLGKIYSTCATSHCRIARNVGWGREITGLTTPHPLEYATDVICSSTGNHCPGGDYIYAKRTNKGQFPPYLGSNVKTKVTSLQDMAARAEPLVCTSARIARYAKWLNIGENSQQLLKKCIYTICDPDIFDNFFDDEEDESWSSGCVEHRFNPASASEGCFINYAPQIGSTVYLSSDNMPVYGKGQANYTLHFQALYCWLQYLTAYSHQSNYYHYHLCCTECIVPINDEMTDIPPLSDAVDRAFDERIVEKLRETLGFLDTKMEMVEHDKRELEHRNKVNPEDITQDEINAGFHSILTLKSALSLMHIQKGALDWIGTEDLQSFPRVYSYKLFPNRVLRWFVHWLLLIKAKRMGKLPFDENFIQVKKKLKNQLTKSPLDRYKTVSSLMLGRGFSTVLNEPEVLLNQGEYPESVSGFIQACKMAVIHQLEVSNSFAIVDQREIVLPSVDVSAKEECWFLMSLTLRRYSCDKCLAYLWNKLIGEENQYISMCKVMHIDQMSRNIKYVLMTLDKQAKMIDAVPSKEDPMPIMIDHDHTGRGLLSLNLYYTRDVCTTYHILLKLNELKKKRQICFPTSAAYKWDIALSCLRKPYHFRHIVVLGDGTGATSHVMALSHPSSLIYPAAFFEGGKTIPQDSRSLHPFLSRKFNNVMPTLIETVCDDVMDCSWVKQFGSFLDKLGRTNVLIIIDLEGIQGNRQLLQQVLEACNGMEGILAKCYMHERPNLGRSEIKSCFTNLHCNLQYGEAFISNQHLTAEIAATGRMCLNDIMDISEASFIKSVEVVEAKYQQMLEVSRRLCRNVFYKHLLPISDDDIKGIPAVSLYRLMIYLSSNFKVTYEPMLKDDNRKMLDGIYRRITVGIKLMCILLFGPSVQDTQWYRYLKLSRAERPERAHSLKRMQLFITTGEKEFIPSSRDVTAALSLHYGLHRGPEYIVIPETLEDLYVRYIIPGKELTGVLDKS